MCIVCVGVCVFFVCECMCAHVIVFSVCVEAHTVCEHAQDVCMHMRWHMYTSVRVHMCAFCLHVVHVLYHVWLFSSKCL